MPIWCWAGLVPIDAIEDIGGAIVTAGDRAHGPVESIEVLSAVLASSGQRAAVRGRIFATPLLQPGKVHTAAWWSTPKQIPGASDSVSFGRWTRWRTVGGRRRASARGRHHQRQLSTRSCSQRIQRWTCATLARRTHCAGHGFAGGAALGRTGRFGGTTAQDARTLSTWGSIHWKRWGPCPTRWVILFVPLPLWATCPSDGAGSFAASY